MPMPDWKRKLVGKLAGLSWSSLFLVLLLVVAVAVLSQLSEQFLTVGNLLEIGRMSTEVGLISLGMTLVIITAGIDLSVGSIVGLCAVVLGMLHGQGVSLWLAVPFTVLAGAVLGYVNAALIARLGIPALIVTLATLAVYRGAALGLSQGASYGGYAEGFLALGQGYLFGVVPYQLLVLAAFAVATWWLLTRTAFGRFIFAIGKNSTAARFAGVDTQKVLLYVYTGIGALSGLASVVYVARISSAKADAGFGFELDAITAVVLGGTAISGGAGNVWNTLLGLLLVGMVRNGLTLAFVPPEVQNVIVGGLLLLAVLVNQVLQLWDKSRARRRAVTVQRVRA